MRQGGQKGSSSGAGAQGPGAKTDPPAALAAGGQGPSRPIAPIRVTVKYLSVLRDQAGLRQEVVALPEGSRLQDLARGLEESHGFVYGDRRIMFILNGRGWGQYPQALKTPLADGDTVLLSVPVAGG